MSERNLILSGIVEPNQIGDLIKTIRDINTEDLYNLQHINGYEPEPIELIVNSTGGSCNDGFALIDVIENSVTPIYTICYGSAYSMGLTIFIAGHQRYCGKLSRFMYHQLSHEFEGKLGDHKINTKELEKLQKIYDDYLISKTNLTQSDLDKVGTSDWYLSAQEALDLGITEYIIDGTQEEDEYIEEE
jgi:ATP-dependent Clp protease protease subunit